MATNLPSDMQQYLLDEIKSKQGLELTKADTTFSAPSVINTNGRNTQVQLTATINGDQPVKIQTRYNRLDAAQLFSSLPSEIEDLQETYLSQLVARISNLRGVSFDTAHFVDGPIQRVETVYTTSVTLTAKSNSLLMTGSYTISLNGVPPANPWVDMITPLTDIKFWARGTSDGLVDKGPNGISFTSSGTGGSVSFGNPILTTNTSLALQNTNKGTYATVTSGPSTTNGFTNLPDNFIVGGVFSVSSDNADTGNTLRLIWKPVSTAGNAEPYYAIYVNKVTNKFVGRIFLRTGVFWDVEGGPSIVDNTPYLVMVRKWGRDLSLWINGARVALTTLSIKSDTVGAGVNTSTYLLSTAESNNHVNAKGSEFLLAGGLFNSDFMQDMARSVNLFDDSFTVTERMRLQERLRFLFWTRFVETSAAAIVNYGTAQVQFSNTGSITQSAALAGDQDGGNAFTFAGGAYLNTPQGSADDPVLSTSNFMTGAFVRPPANAAGGRYGRIIGRQSVPGTAVAPFLAWGIFYDTGLRAFVAKLLGDDGTIFFLRSGTPVVDGTNYITCLRRIDDKVSIWVNGIKTGELTLPSPTYPLITYQGSLFIGGGSNAQEYLTGGIFGEAFVSDTTISDADMAAVGTMHTVPAVTINPWLTEIATMPNLILVVRYEDTVLIDGGDGNRTVGPSGTAVSNKKLAGVSPNSGNCWQIPAGSYSYSGFTAGDNLNTTDFTALALFKQEVDTASFGTAAKIMTLYNSSSGLMAWGVWYEKSTKLFKVTITSGTNVVNTMTSTTTAVAGNGYLVALRRSDRVFSLWINGIKEAEVTVAIADATLSAQVGVSWYGGYTAARDNFPCYADEFIFAKTAISDARMLRMAQAVGLVPRTDVR